MHTHLREHTIMSNTMKAAVVHAFGHPLTIEDVPIPAPGPGEVLLRVVASGVCHTDVHAAEGDWPVKPSLPFIPGHEAVGDVVALGPGVGGVAVGDRVGVPWLLSACGGRGRAGGPATTGRPEDGAVQGAQGYIQAEGWACGVPGARGHGEVLGIGARARRAGGLDAARTTGFRPAAAYAGARHDGTQSNLAPARSCGCRASATGASGDA